MEIKSNQEKLYIKTNKVSKYIFTILKIIIWCLFIGGLFVLWKENELGIFGNIIATSFGILGMLSYVNV
jgi:hypothetical protein